MAKPNLLVLGSTFPVDEKDGTPSFVLDLAKEQAKSFDVTVLTPYVSGAKRVEVMGDVKVIRYHYWPFAHSLARGAILDNLKANPLNWLQMPFLVLGLISKLKKLDASLNPAAIHAHWVIPQGLAAAIAAKNTKLVITAHGGDVYALNKPPLRALKKMVLQRASAITTVNSVMKHRLVEMGIDQDKIHVLPMGVDLGLASATTKPKQKNQLVFVGRLVEKKGLEFLISAIRQLSETDALPADISLKIAGDGPLRSQLEAQSAGLPVEFLGSCSKQRVLELLAESEIALLPSVRAKSGDQEGLPVTLLEAGASSLAVIASDLDGINELIADGENGLLVPPGDAGALASAITKLLTDPELSQRLGAALRVSVADYDHSVVGAKYNSLLGSL